MAADAIVVGGGALGWASAEALASAGARAILIDPGETSASSVAAGMIAPALEAALEVTTPEQAALYRKARDLWPALADRRGLALRRAGALWAGAAGPEAERLAELGFAAEVRAGGVFTPEDWTIDPAAALAALPGEVAPRRARATTAGPGWVELAGGERLTAGHVVLAVGVGRLRAPEAAAAFAAVSPIKGQIALARGVERPPYPLRAPGVYVVPRADGVVVGATMEPGRTDSVVDPEAVAALVARGAELWPPLRAAEHVEGWAGVRGSTPDGLPLIGPVAPGLTVALAPRRNGWLLAPLVGRMVAAYAAGDDPGRYAEALGPLRFEPGVRPVGGRDGRQTQ